LDPALLEAQKAKGMGASVRWQRMAFQTFGKAAEEIGF
jgi:hypothetical protein